MAEFKPWLEISTTGVNSVGKSPYGRVSVFSEGVVGIVGVFMGTNFYPHPDGAIDSGGMFSFDCGVGREVGINVTSGTGIISTAKV